MFMEANKKRKQRGKVTLSQERNKITVDSEGLTLGEALRKCSEDVISGVSFCGVKPVA